MNLLTNIQFVPQRICESKDAAPDLTRAAIFSNMRRTEPEA
jgi:hypothetical protein